MIIDKNEYGYFITNIIIIIMGLALIHKDTLMWMYGRYINSDSYYSHGFLIPAIFLYLIWMKREKLGKLSSQPSWSGLIIILGSLLLHYLGTILYVFSISGFSIFFFILGVILYFFGWSITKALLFPIFFLLFMFPVPESFITTISFPLKRFVAIASVELVKMIEIPVFIDGFNISIPSGVLLVGNPCSGLRSLISFLALGSLFAYLIEASIIKKWILLFMTIPIALLVNLVRVIMIILISHQWGLEVAATDTFLHSATGAVMFVLGLGLFHFCSKLLCDRRL